jgi:hypothetical protein
LLIWASQLAASHCRLCTRFLPPIVALALVASAASSLAVFPHSQSYFNELAGGPLNGPAHLLDANVDWGQDLLYLRRWYDAHPAARPFYLAWFGFIEPSLAGIDSQPLRDAPEGRGLRGWCAVSVNELYGYDHFGPRSDSYDWLRRRTPAGHAGYSVRIYDLSPDQ